MDKCRESPPTDWPASAYVLVGREDLAMAKLGSLKSQDDVNLTSISVPYMLHLQPVTSPSSVSDITRSDSLNPEDSDSLYRSVEDGTEHIFNSSTQLRYGRDLRFNEVCTFSSPVIISFYTLNFNFVFLLNMLNIQFLMLQ